MTRPSLTSAQRRRDRRILAALLAEGNGGSIALHHAPDFRAARRLMRAGKCCAVASRISWFNRRSLKEVTIFRTRADALRVYYASSIMREGKP